VSRPLRVTGEGGVRRLEGVVDLLRLHRADPRRYPHLLESAARHPRTGRWDILFAFPGECIDGAEAVLRALDRPWPRLDEAPSLPFLGGWFVYLGYETGAAIEPRLRAGLPPSAAEETLPEARLQRFPAAVLVDHHEGCTWLVAEPGWEGCLATMAADLERLPTLPDAPLPALLLEEEAPERFLDGVARIRRYIREGDVFQVNLSRLWRGAGQGIEPAALYGRLRRANPGPFCALATWAEGAVISSSPERLLWSDGDAISTRPIAGTLPRGGEDPRRLLGDPKERAEHIMLIDLERNDLGRVCRSGSVRVDELMVLESYAHVHHIVSNVSGRLIPGVTPAQAVAAVFPGGTITGCPKVRCMEIIAELEGARRGPYTGSLGYLSRHGTMDLNILIRSFVLQGGTLSLRAGAGIVADSQPARELVETRAKARGLLAALEGP